MGFPCPGARASRRLPPPGWILGTAGSLRPSTPSPISSTRFPFWRGSAARLSSCSSAGHLAVGSVLLVLGLLAAGRLSRHGRRWLAVFAVGYAIRAVVWICGSNLPLVPGDSCHCLEIATSVLSGEGPVKHYVGSFFRDYSHIREGRGGLDDWDVPLDAYVAGIGVPACGTGTAIHRSRLESPPPRDAASSSTSCACRHSTSSRDGDTTRGSRSVRWPHWPCCRCMRSTPASCFGRAWSR